MLLSTHVDVVVSFSWRSDLELVRPKTLQLFELSIIFSAELFLGSWAGKTIGSWAGSWLGGWLLSWFAFWVDLLGSAWDLLGLESVSGNWSKLFVPLEDSFLELEQPVGSPYLGFLWVIEWRALPP